MTTLDHFTARRAPRVDSRNIAMAVTTLLLLALGAVALTAPPTTVPHTWHGNVGVSVPR